MEKNPIRLRAILTFAQPPHRRRRPQPVPMAADLFGGFAVSPADVALWLRRVPRIEPDSPRAAAYVRNYDVLGKIIEAKRSGEFALLEAANDS